MSKDTKNKSKTSTIPSGFCGNTQGSDAQNLINERLKSFSYESTSDLSCIALNQWSGWGAAMTSPAETLARRAVACPEFRWMRGMLCLTDEDGYAARILSVGLTGKTSETADSYDGGGIITRGHIRDEALPDLDDPATLGCLLALVREAWGVILVSDNESGTGWVVVAGDCGAKTSVTTSAETLAEALIAALEAAGGEG